MARLIHSAIAAAFVAASATAAAAVAPTPTVIPSDPGARALAFATCFGRYAARTEHAWIVGESDAPYKARRDLFEDLLDTVLPDARAHGLSRAELIGHRLGAKREQSRMLHVAEADPDARRARTAATIARRNIRVCDALV